MKKSFVRKITYFLLTIFSFSAFSQKLIRNPYLQQPTENSIIIRWRTDIPTSSKVIFSKNGEQKISEVINSLPKTEHIIQITNLEPDTKYFYSVGNAEKELLKTNFHYFTTTPKSNTKRPIRIWAMGDFGDESAEKYINNRIDVRNQYLKNRKGQTDLWLWLGDNAYCCGTDIEYQKQVFDFYGNEIFGNIPILPAPGNHEYYNRDDAKKDRIIPYFDMIDVPVNGEAGGVPSRTKAYYSYNYGNTHFISLDSYGLDEGKYHITDKQSPQYKWLEKDLENNKSLWTVIYFHHPPYTKRSHDSDAEGDLIAIRENLVPLFDKYKVDLVLNGHSHVYERSYLMRSHLAESKWFDKKVFAMQQTDARYTATSKPIINKDDGTIYVVVGSAGRLDWNNDPNPHPSSVYANYEIGGSLSLTIDENRLDAEWICSDGIIRDNFTVFKNVNKTNKITAEFGVKTNLTASWKGTHRWSNGIKNQQNIEVLLKKDSVFTVSDSLGHLSDKFEIKVLPQPKTSSQIISNENICAGKEVKVSFDLSNTTIEKWNFSLELSDKNGSFAKPIILDKGSKNNFTAILPDTLSEGEKYRFRVHADSDFFEEIPTNFFKINKLADVKFLNVSPIPSDLPIILKVQSKGTLPVNVSISNLGEYKLESSISEIRINSSKSSTYEIEKVSNICGIGKGIGEKVTVLEPLSFEDKSENFTIYPNPTTGFLYIETNSEKNLKTKISITNSVGKKVFEKSSFFNSKEEISIQSLPDGIYFVQIKNRNSQFSKKIVKN